MHKSLCFMAEIREVCVCDVRAVFIRIDQSVSCGKCPYSCGVCSRALSCNGILNILLYISQGYVYLNLTKGKRSCCCE